MIAVAQFTPQGTSAAVYYMIHSTLAAGALFLIMDMVGARRGDLWLRLDRVMPGNGWLPRCISPRPSPWSACRRFPASSASSW